MNTLHDPSQIGTRPSHPVAESRPRAGARRFACTALLCALGLLGAPSFEPASDASSTLRFGPASASAGDAEDWLEKAEEKLRRKKILQQYDGLTRKAIREEWKRLGKKKAKNFDKAVENVTNGGAGNSVISRDAFAQTVFPILRANCRNCHAGSGPGFPSIADDQPTAAFDAVMSSQKVRLSDPVRSRLVQRLSNDEHYCWSDCDDDAAEMQAAIEEWSAIEESMGGQIDVNAIVSNSSSMGEGKLDRQKGRIEDHVIAKWEFREGTGETARDSSGVDPAMDLTLDRTAWLSNYGLLFDDRRAAAFATPEASKKLWREIASPQKGSQQYSIEMWVAPDNIEQDNDPRIASYSDGTDKRNFSVAQNLYSYSFRNRSRAQRSDKNGQPDLATDNDDRDAQAALQHVVMTYDRLRGRRIYVNGRFTGDDDAVRPDLLMNWNKDFTFILGNETSRDRGWEGAIRFVAIHRIALSKKQININMREGVGQRFLVKFGLDDWLTTQGNFVEFTVREFDAYSYLFCEPTFSGPPPLDYQIENMRVAVNGVLPVSGQAFVHTEAIISQDGDDVSRLCSVIPKDLGPDDDRFSIHFGRLGDFRNVIAEPIPTPPAPVDGVPMPEIGVRSFEQVNLTMAAVTGVDPLTNAVRTTYDEIRQALPSTTDPRSFVSSHQVGVSKLALDYCDAMVEDAGLRDAFFGTAPPFEFDQPVPTAFSTQAKRDQVIDALYDGVIGTNIGDQPLRADVATIVDGLITTLTTGCDAASCPAVRTRTVVKATCAAVLSSAAMMIQ